MEIYEQNESLTKKRNPRDEFSQQLSVGADRDLFNSITMHTHTHRIRALSFSNLF
jgi:hypothetical protein